MSALAAEMARMARASPAVARLHVGHRLKPEQPAGILISLRVNAPRAIHCAVA